MFAMVVFAVVMIRALDCDSKGRGFESRPLRFQLTTLGKLFAQMCRSVTKHYNLVYRSKGGDALQLERVTVGLSSHWPCVTDFSGWSRD